MTASDRWRVESYERDGEGGLVYQHSVHLGYDAAMWKRTELNRKGRDIVIVRRQTTTT